MDVIDLSVVDARASVAGDQAFLNVTQGTSAVVFYGLRWYEADGFTIIQGDVNGNATADIVIRLEGTGLQLTAGDFVL